MHLVHRLLGIYCVVFALGCAHGRSGMPMSPPSWRQTVSTPFAPVDSAKAIRTEENIAWYRGEDLWVEGRGWSDTKAFWNRLPARVEGMVTPTVWGLQDNTAGMAVRFRTDSKALMALWSGGGAMNHMAASGVSGLDAYRRTDQGTWKYLATGRPKETETTVTLTSKGDGTMREYLVFLPLYHNVTRLEFGVDAGARVQIPTEFSGPPIVFYGTSITQGGCASRTGMAHAAMLRRWLDREVINLGFSGSGKMEPIMEELLAELDAGMYILDCLPNLTDDEMKERVEPFVRKLRADRPDTPIVMVSHILFSEGSPRNSFYRGVCEKLRGEGMKKLYYVSGPAIYEGEEEGSVDGVHPTDLGFYRMAKGMRPAMEAILRGEDGRLDWP